MSDFESYLIRQRGFTTQSARSYVDNLKVVDKMIGEGGADLRREREFRRQARGTLSPDDITNCVTAMRAFADYKTPSTAA